MLPRFPFTPSYFTSILHAGKPESFQQPTFIRTHRVLHYAQRMLGPVCLTYVVIQEESLLEAMERECLEFTERSFQAAASLKRIINRKGKRHA